MLSPSKGLHILRNMGGRYMAFRVIHELKVRTGLFKRKFPRSPPFKSYISLADWRKISPNFFFRDRFDISFRSDLSDQLTQEFNEIIIGSFTYFSSLKFNLGPTYDWVTNPDTGYSYPGSAHWTQINDYSKEAGDIKYVWEKSRFSFVYSIIRYDARTGEDHAGWLWKEILSWIEANPINSGPNYKCSQEISLRVLNWTFALNFYKQSSTLTEDIFQKILYAIYWQLHHVYSNINFSRIAVRNNHAITETLTLYLGGLLFPFFPGSQIWKEKGKKWFEDEIAYQVYPDGTFLQFSMNYHRVVIQLLTWGIRLAQINKERFADVVYERANESLSFLVNCMDPSSGQLPNYGANDGALFFKLSDSHYRDYRPQLEALSYALGLNWMYEKFEDYAWFGLVRPASGTKVIEANKGLSIFKDGGYYFYRQNDAFSFIRCGNHKDRPSQADNLHLDVWCKGINILHDAGSYKYNTDNETLKYFMGTQSHNTIMLDDFDQMEKGARFIWYNWSQCEEVNLTEDETCFQFEGTVKAFEHVSSAIRHYRKVRIFKTQQLWEVEDKVLNKPAHLSMKQFWHTSYPDRVSFVAQLANGISLEPLVQVGSFSSFYGQKEESTEIVFSTKENFIKTFISVGL